MTTATLSAAAVPRRPQVLNITLWSAQLILAAAFGFAGWFKVSTPMEALNQAMAWTAAMPAAGVRFIGAAELAGAIGLVLPMLTRIKPQLTVFAGLGLTIIMVLASLFHILRGEFQALPINITLGAVAAFIAWGRSARA